MERLIFVVASIIPSKGLREKFMSAAFLEEVITFSNDWKNMPLSMEVGSSVQVLDFEFVRHLPAPCHY